MSSCILCHGRNDLEEITLARSESLNSGFRCYGVKYNTTKVFVCKRCLEREFRKISKNVYIRIYDKGFCLDGEYSTASRLQNNPDVYFCSMCGIYHKVSNRPKFSIQDDNGITFNMCELGYSNMVTICTRCGKAFLSNNIFIYNTEGYCDNCYKSIMKYKIKGYHERVDLSWYNKVEDKNIALRRNPSIPYFGFELEIGAGGERDDISQKVIEELNEEVYTMHDGSIDSGFEIISHPHTEDALYNLPYDNVFRNLSMIGYRSHDIGCCGLHLHIGREMFNSQESLAKMLYFYENNKQDIMRFSRRSAAQLDRWAAFYSYDEGVSLSDCYAILNDYDEGDCHDDRYKAVNLQRSSTVEIRCMRGTLNPHTFRATLDFIITVAKNSNNISKEDIDNIDLWLDGIKQETKDYMMIRGCFGYHNDNDEEELEI